MSEPHVAAELEPRFLVTVTLDGDEWPPTATEQAEIELRHALDTIDLRGGVIRAYTIRAGTVTVAALYVDPAGVYANLPA